MQCLQQVPRGRQAGRRATSPQGLACCPYPGVCNAVAQDHPAVIHSSGKGLTGSHLLSKLEEKSGQETYLQRDLHRDSCSPKPSPPSTQHLSCLWSSISQEVPRAAGCRHFLFHYLPSGPSRGFQRRIHFYFILSFKNRLHVLFRGILYVRKYGIIMSI